MATDVPLGTKIRRARERKRLTQRQLAAAVDASVRAVGGWERGESVPRNRIGALESALGIDLTGTPDGGPVLTPAEQEAWEALAALGVPEDARWETILAARQRNRAAVPAPGREAG